MPRTGFPQAPVSPRLALVLSGGGARAAYQVGVLSGIAERLPNVRFPILTGVSAGAINTAFLAAHPGPLPEAVAALRESWGHLTTDTVFRAPARSLTAAALRWAFYTLLGQRRGPTAVRGILDTAPLRAFLTRHVDPAAIEANLTEGRLRAVALTATSLASGRGVTFVQGPPDMPMWSRAMREAVRARLSVDHIMASAAIPILFPAVRLTGGFFGDGGVRQIAPLAPALHLGGRAVLAIGLRSVQRARVEEPLSTYPSAVALMGLMLETVFLNALEADAERLERINALLAAVPPGSAAPDGLRPVQLMLMRPSRDLGALALEHMKRLPWHLRWLVRRMGGERADAADFMSYLLFEPPYTSRVMELGHEDAAASWPALEAFFERAARIDVETP